jgi:hypothetical protein
MPEIATVYEYVSENQTSAPKASSKEAKLVDVFQAYAKKVKPSKAKVLSGFCVHI